MTPQQWTDVDAYLDATLTRADPALDHALRHGADAGLPAIAVSPSQGKLLHILALGIGARRVLEIGTLGGYSTIWLARALPADGSLVTLELDARHAEVARSNLAGAGLSCRVEVITGAALDVLPILAARDPAHFDMVFIDADKNNSPGYVDWAIRLTRPGGLIVLDNVIREGEVTNSASTDGRVIGTRAALDRMGSDPRLVSTALQTVGSKGYDGLAIAYRCDRK